MIDLSVNIKAIIKEKGLNQEKVAKKMNLSQSGFNLIINGNRSIEVQFLFQIANILNENITYFFTYPKRYNYDEINNKKTDEFQSRKFEDINAANEFIMILEAKLKEKDNFIDKLLNKK